MCAKFHVGHRGLESPKTSRFVPKMDFSWGQKVAALGGQEGPAKWQDFDFWPLETKKRCLQPPVTWRQEGAAKGQEICTRRAKNQNSQI